MRTCQKFETKRAKMMMYLTVLLLAASLCNGNVLREEGPACDDSERYDCNGVTTKVVDPNDCTIWYNCDANIQQPCPLTCPAGLGFDEALQVCNWEASVPACTTRRAVRSVTEGPACADSERYDCNGVITKVVDPNDCTVWYNCDANIQHPCPLTCPPGLGFNEAIQVCDWQVNVPACA